MTYHNAVKYVKNAPAAFSGDHSLERARYLLSLLGDPQKRIRYIRLTGTNGKTICGAMISSVLSLSGYSVCELNFSDSIDVRENIKLNGIPLDLDVFTELISEVASLSLTLKHNIEAAKAELEPQAEPSETATNLPYSLIHSNFPAALTKNEIIFLATLIYCKKHRVDLCVVESSGEHDTSLILPPPFAAVICGAIPSNDKRQIIKIKNYLQRGISEVVSAPDAPEAYKAISDACAAINCRLSVPIRSALIQKQLTLTGSRFVYGSEEYKLSLCGRFQTTNAITALETFKLLRRHGFKIPLEAEKQGLVKAKIPARFEVLSVRPTIIADSTYKPEAVETVCESLFDFSEITGRELSLCLPPDASLINRYRAMLEARGYNICEIYTLCNDSEELSALKTELGGYENLFSAPSYKALTKLIFSNQTQTKLLLVSGHNSFTFEVRREILRKLQF